MENSFFIFSDANIKIAIERLHICTWEFNNNSSLVEFGLELSAGSVREDLDSLEICLSVPWANSNCKIKDLFEQLRDAENSRFLFNDSVKSTTYLDSKSPNRGAIQNFNARDSHCVIPSELIIDENNIIRIKLNLIHYNRFFKENSHESKPNIYTRFWINPSACISLRKNGINKSTIIYDIKVNERRNISDCIESKMDAIELCQIARCFLFHIIPNEYSIIFTDEKTLKNVRTLEYSSFKKYLADKRLKRDDLMVIFNKKEASESFSFFSIYSKERIGTGQFVLAILANIVCGILLFMPAYRKSISPEISFRWDLLGLPFEIYACLAILLIMIMYFSKPKLKAVFNGIKTRKI